MADKTILVQGADLKTLPVLLHDNGDGTYSLGTSGSSGGGGGAATIADGADATQGAVADAAVTTDANGTLSAKLRGLVTQIGAVTASPVANTVQDRLKALLTGISLAAGEAHLGAVGGQKVRVNTEVTRPADTTAYSALDVLSDSTSAPTVLTFTNVARVVGGGGYIVGARLLTDQKTNVARFRLHLFHTAPTAINDNSPYLLLYANRANRVGQITFPACATEDSSNSTAANAFDFTVRIPFVCAAADRNLYGLLEVLDAFTPANGQKVFIELVGELD